MTNNNNPFFIPSTGTPVENGLNFSDMLAFLENLENLNKTNIYNIDLVELNTMIGSKKQIKKSIKNTRKLFNLYSTMTFDKDNRFIFTNYNWNQKCLSCFIFVIIFSGLIFLIKYMMDNLDYLLN